MKAHSVKQLLDCKASPVTALYLQNNAMKGYKPIHLACKVGSKQILSLIMLSIFENCNNFQLNEKTNENEDPLDLILSNFEDKNEATQPNELFECVKLLIGAGHAIRQVHTNRLKQLLVKHQG